jgi:hypothetical protein
MPVPGQLDIAHVLLHWCNVWPIKINIETTFNFCQHESVKKKNTLIFTYFVFVVIANHCSPSEWIGEWKIYIKQLILVQIQGKPVH